MSDHTMVFIVDDDVAVRDSLTMLMEAADYAVVSFPGAADFLDACTPSTQGCIILDVDMPDMDGPTLQEELIRRGLRLPVIFLSGKGTIPVTVRTIKAGAMDFLTKPVDGSVLLARVQKALEQGSLLQKQAEAFQSVALRLAALTKREREIMMLAIAGHTSKEIAQRLAISYRTVEIHRAHVMQKTDASNLLELARIADLLDRQNPAFL
jgi:two-component system, LuxR family, response regulator FixJ